MISQLDARDNLPRAPLTSTPEEVTICPSLNEPTKPDRCSKCSFHPIFELSGISFFNHPFYLLLPPPT
jgi:hypothetical protein